MLIAVVEELYRPNVPEALYLDLEGVNPLRVHPAGIRIFIGIIVPSALC